mmetsp:Transcript_44083/g.122628  ORF Transcript_44083/g.122628 Transcript_44083/m.122628 type:complete len:156 (+) Transcript_44083:227-694(+)
MHLGWAAIIGEDGCTLEGESGGEVGHQTIVGTWTCGGRCCVATNLAWHGTGPGLCVHCPPATSREAEPAGDRASGVEGAGETTCAAGRGGVFPAAIVSSGGGGEGEAPWEGGGEGRGGDAAMSETPSQTPSAPMVTMTEPEPETEPEPLRNAVWL